MGDIEDEHDEEEAASDLRRPKLGLVASGRAPVKAPRTPGLGTKLLKAEEEADIDTLGGLVFSHRRAYSARGELVRHSSGVEFEVLDADPRRVKKLKIHVPQSARAMPVSPDREELFLVSERRGSGSGIVWATWRAPRVERAGDAAMALAFACRERFRMLAYLRLSSSGRFSSSPSGPRLAH